LFKPADSAGLFSKLLRMQTAQLADSVTQLFERCLQSTDTKLGLAGRACCSLCNGDYYSGPARVEHSSQAVLEGVRRGTNWG
jgi:hypothetical protein